MKRVLRIFVWLIVGVASSTLFVGCGDSNNDQQVQPCPPGQFCGSSAIPGVIPNQGFLLQTGSFGLRMNQWSSSISYGSIWLFTAVHPQGFEFSFGPDSIQSGGSPQYYYGKASNSVRLIITQFLPSWGNEMIIGGRMELCNEDIVITQMVQPNQCSLTSISFSGINVQVDQDGWVLPGNELICSGQMCNM